MVNVGINSKKELLSLPTQRQESPPQRPLSPVKGTGARSRPCLLGGLTESFLSPDPWSMGGWESQATEEIGGITKARRR